MVLRPYGSVVRCDNGLADRKADAHAFVGIAAFAGGVGIPVKQPGKPLGIDAGSEVPDMKDGVGLRYFCLQFDRLAGAAVIDGIFQQIDQHLLDEGGVHGNHDKFIWNLYLHLGLWEPFVKPADSGGNHFLQRLQRRFDAGGLVADPRDGQQVFHHPVQPFGVGADVAQKLELLLPVEQVIVVDDRGAGAVDRGQRRAQVVGNRPQQIAANYCSGQSHWRMLLSLHCLLAA